MNQNDSHRTVDIDFERPRLISWAAIFAGLFVVVGMSWLLYLLGAALGVSVADATDGAAIGNGLGIGAVIWMILTPCAAFFIGSLLTSRLSGKTDDTVGILHGISLWGVSTTLIIVLGFFGMSQLVQTGQGFISAAGNAAGTTITGVASAAQSTAQATVRAADAAIDSPLSDNIQARLKRKASSYIADLDARGGADVNADEIRLAIDGLDQQALTDITSALIAGETQTAREEMRSATGLSEDEVREIIEGMSTEVQELIGEAGDDQGLVADISTIVRDRVSGFVADLDDAGGAEITQSDIRQAINELDAAALQRVSLRLIQGDPEAAKDVLTANTSLSDRQIDELVTSVVRDIETELADLQTAAAEATEAASDYAVAVLWSAFGVAALSLVMCIFGGWIGTESTRQIEVRRGRV
ncbi:MAG: hypothetical protein AAGF47_02255 [Planctomycetota bacterium]